MCGPYLIDVSRSSLREGRELHSHYSLGSFRTGFLPLHGLRPGPYLWWWWWGHTHIYVRHMDRAHADS